MSRKKQAGKEISIVRSSAAEYLNFVAATGDNELEEAAVIKQYLTTAADGKGHQRLAQPAGENSH